MPWNWESFPGLSGLAVDSASFDIDIGAQLPHAALRVYVMGERGARREPATAEDNSAMAALAGEAVARRRARLLDLAHAEPPHLDRRLTPTLNAGEDELTAIAGAMHGVGRSVLQFVLDLADHRRRSADDAAGRGEHQAARCRSR